MTDLEAMAPPPETSEEIQKVFNQIDTARNTYPLPLEGHPNAVFLTEDFVRHLKLIEAFVLAISQSTQPPFRMEVWDAHAVVRAKPILRTVDPKVAQYLPLLPNLLIYADPDYWRVSTDDVSLRFDCSERAKLFFRSVQDLELELSWFRGPSLKERAWKQFNDLVENIRQRLQSPEFQQATKQRKIDTETMRQKMFAYEAALFDRYARLLVVRIDLLFHKEHYDISLAEAQAYRDRFFQQRRSNSTFTHLLGYIWRLESGQVRGIHLHVVLFFDGSAVMSDYDLANRAGRYWVALTEGKGHYYNCSMQRPFYRSIGRDGIGMIAHDEADRRKNLRTAITYFAHQDEYLRLAAHQRVRLWGHGQLPKGPKSKRGRPRGKLLGSPASESRATSGNCPSTDGSDQ